MGVISAARLATDANAPFNKPDAAFHSRDMNANIATLENAVARR